MREFRADLHIHSVLSPCGDLDMSPVKLVKAAAAKGLDIIGITDHNSTLHCSLVRELGEENGIFVLTGVEVNTKEEIHCLAFFEKFDELSEFQDYMDKHLGYFKNDPDIFGYQVQVNRNDEIIYEEERSLYAAMDQSIEQIEAKVHQLNGIFIPAHIDRPRNSIYSQLGFLPEGLKADALEISWATDPGDFMRIHPEVSKFEVLRSSDAHFPEDIGRACTLFSIRNRSFAEIKMAFGKVAGREVHGI